MNSTVNTTLENVCDFIGGSQPAKKYFSEIKLEGYIRLIQIRDYKTDKYVTYIPENSTRKFCNETDVMIGRYGPPIFQILRGISGAYNVALMKAIPKENILNNYLYYFLSQEHLFEYVNALSPRTGGQTGVDVVMLKKYPIQLPNLSTQKQIVKVLSDLDTNIELNNKINSELEAMAKLIYDYWFVQFDFPDKNGKPYKSSGGKMVYNKELKREIPEGWEVGLFKDVLDDLQSGNRPKGGINNIENGIPSIGAENILSIGKYNYGSEKIIPEEFYNEMTKGIIESGDVLMYKDGASLGRVSMFKNGFPYEKCCINSHAFILRTNEKITQNYIYFWLDQDFMKEIIRRAGMRAAQPGINQVNVNELVILIPDASIIEKFESQITSSIDKIFANALQNKKLAELRDWLLPMLMNGQVRVN